MTESVQEVEVSRLSVEASLADARGTFARFYISPDQADDLAAAGRPVPKSLGYLDRLFAGHEEAADITPVDRLMDTYVSAVAYGLAEQATAAKRLLGGMYSGPDLAWRLSGEIRHFMGVEKRIFGKYDNPRWERLRTARRQLSHTEAPSGAERVEKPRPLREKIAAAAGRLSLRGQES